MSAEDKIWYLKGINLLKDLSESDLMRLSGQCSMAKYGSGDVIYFRDQQPNIYFIKSGAVKLVQASEGGTERLVEVIEAGEIFGRLVDSESWADERVVAVGEIVVCFLPYAQWRQFIRSSSDLEFSFFKWVGFRIRRLERRMDALYFKTSRQRIVDQLEDICNRFGKIDSRGHVRVRLSITHEELAQLAGTSRQHVTSYLSELRQDGLIDYNRFGFEFMPAFIEKKNKLTKS